MNFLGLIKLLVSLLPMVFDAIQAAETALGPGKGVQKLAQAVSAVKAVLPADAVEHADSVDALLPSVISAAVDLMNRKGELPPSQPAAVAVPASSG
jgi:hypothetical protein